MMTVDDVIAIEQYNYRHIIDIVKQRLDWMGFTDLSTPIYPLIGFDYPILWEAVVGIDDRLYVFANIYGKLHITQEPFVGFRKNGLPIRQ